MTNRLLLVQNRSFLELEASLQEHVEASLRRVCGSRLVRCNMLSQEITASGFSDSVFAVPIALPERELDVKAVLREIEKVSPAPALFGVVFILVGGRGFSPDGLLSSFWVEMLDNFYDLAVPTAFVALHGDAAQTQTFHLVSAVSGLFRDLDNLQELRRIGAVLADLESRVGALEEPFR